MSTQDIVQVVTPPCVVCGEVAVVELTVDEFQRVTRQREDGKRYYLIQDALPDRDDDFRELILTGTHRDCWDRLFPPEEDDDD